MSVQVIDTLKPKNNGVFPVVEAEDVAVSDSLRLPEALNQKAEQIDLEELSDNLAEKASISDLTTATSNLQAQIDQLITPVTQDAEVQNARVGADGTSYQTLKARLDAEEQKQENGISKLSDKIYEITDAIPHTDQLTLYRKNYNTTTNEIEDSTTRLLSEPFVLSKGDSVAINSGYLFKVYRFNKTTGNYITTVADYTASFTVSDENYSNYAYRLLIASTTPSAEITPDDVTLTLDVKELPKEYEECATKLELDSKANQSEVDEIKSDIKNISYYDFSNDQSGHYINYEGNVSDSDSYKISSVISVTNGTRIDFTARGTSTAVSMISKKIDSTYTPLVISIDSTVRTYTYTATEDCDIVLSYNASYDHTCELSSEKLATKADISTVESEIADLSNEIQTITMYDFSNDQSGHYINYEGNISDLETYKMSSPIAVENGTVITFIARGTGTAVSMISKKVGSSYTPLVISVDSTVRTYTYTATESCDIVLSYNGNYEHSCKLSLYNFATSELVESEVKSAVEKPNFIQMLTRLAVIGDSLSSGELVTPKAGGGYDYTDVYGNSWLSYLARKINASSRTHYSRGGQTCKTWLQEHTTKMQTDTPFGAYFIALGTNDKRTDVSGYNLGNISDVAGADSFVGYYKQIIELVTEHAPNAVIFCVSLYNEASATNIEYDEMIAAISELYSNCFYVDFANLSDITSDIGGDYISDGHFTSIGYPRVADNIERIVNDIIAHNLSYFKFYTLNNAVGDQYEE